MQPTYLIHSQNYANWIFNPSHPTQGRRFIHAHDQFLALSKKAGVHVEVVEPRKASREELARVHSESYISEVLIDHESSQWEGARRDLSELAALFAGGTLYALGLLLAEKTMTAIHFPGAKHHAQYHYSSGFCIFADFALAAEIASRDHGLKVAILDIDAHHGDGTENLTASNDQVMTFSVHEWGIFPGTGKESEPSCHIYNVPLGLGIHSETGKDDPALLKATESFLEVAGDFKADLIMVACGADGHAEDPLSSLQYSVDGYNRAARALRAAFPETPMLLGGAGGYLPDTRTPEVWSQFALQLSINEGASDVDIY